MPRSRNPDTEAHLDLPSQASLEQTYRAATDEAPSPDWQPFVTLRQYRELAEAQVVRCALESAGIPCRLRDENMIRMQWAWSNLIGGVRLEVRPEDREAAETVLAQPIPESFDAGEGAPFEQPRCPDCGALDIHYQAIHERAGMASILVFVPVPIPKNAWICHACGAEWREDDAELSN